MNKKIILAAGVILVFLGYVAYQKNSSPATVSGNPSENPLMAGGTPSPDGTNQNSVMEDSVRQEGDGGWSGGDRDGGVMTAGASIKVSAPGSSIPSPKPQAVSGPYKDGQYIGALVDAFFGPMQVKAVISGGKLIDVQFLQVPNEAGTTWKKTEAAMPLMKASAIANQSASVDAISGSTQTKEGFELSLASALAQAK